MASTEQARPISRPLSPHLSVYHLSITMVMSILHRITGAALYFGTALVAWWLLAAASGPEAYLAATGFFGSWFGLLVLFGYSWVLLHHMMGGIRHLIWDTGAGFAREERLGLAWATIVASASLTILVWLVVLLVV